MTCVGALVHASLTCSCLTAKEPVFGACLSLCAAPRKHQRLDNLQTPETRLLAVQGLEGWEVWKAQKVPLSSKAGLISDSEAVSSGCKFW